MSNQSAAGGGGVDADVPDAVREWLRSVAAERGVSEAELLRSLLSDADVSDGASSTDTRDMDRLETEFTELVEDVRDRIVQVKREADQKAPADHNHHDLRTTLEELARDVTAVQAEVQQLDTRLGAGFENYEEVLTYLTETTDALDRKLGRLASVLVDMREQVGDAAREEVRRTALAHLADTANRHGVETAKCEDCDEAVLVGMLVQPRCPHCDASFSALEPKTGFFRTSVLHTGTLPALESAPGDDRDAADGLASLVDDDGAPAVDSGIEEPDVESPVAGSDAGIDEPDVASAPSGTGAGSEPETGEVAATEAPAPAEPPTGDPAPQPPEAPADPDPEPPDGPAPDAAEEPPAEPTVDGVDDLQSITGVGPAYADRLESVGIDDLLALAVADPEELGAAIDVPASTVAEWVEQADARTGNT